MEQMVVIYSIVVALLAALIIFIVLVNKNVIMKYSNNVIKRVLTKPLVMYSLRRIASAVISFALAIVVTFCLLRIQDKNLLCTKETGWKKFSAEIRQFGIERSFNCSNFELFLSNYSFPKESLYCSYNYINI